MAPTTTVQTAQSRGGNARGRGGNRGRRGGRGGQKQAGQQPSKPDTAPVATGDEQQNIPDTSATSKPAADEPAPDDAAVCWICAEPVKYYALSECGHRTCHVCALRLRALYKKTECTFCKVRVLLVL